MHVLRGFDSNGGEDGGCEIDVEGEVIIGGAMLLLGHSWIVDDEGDSDAFLMGVPLITESVLGVVVAVVGGEDDEGVVEDALLLEFRYHFSANFIHFGRETVVIFHHALEFFGGVKPPSPTVATFILFVEELGETFPGFLSGIDWNGHFDIPIEFHAVRLREELIGVAVLGVGGKEGEGEAKGFVFGALAQKLHGVVFVAFGDVDFLAIDLIPVLS